ncbi:diacylglycerol diphosphate phosphatase [Acrasis kona]|uniref:Diacylglycerol diphosphate phosphatase n=1 Tax=Acrasis kona TaxID=1008807 RepID=A0AAW2Z3R2_9EUKA
MSETNTLLDTTLRDEKRKYWPLTMPKPLWSRTRREMILQYLLEYIALGVGALIDFVNIRIPWNIFYFRLDDPDFNLPAVPDQVVPNETVSVACIVIPMVICIVFHLLLIRSKVDFHHMVLAFLVSNIISAIPTSLLWWMVGWPRPDFLEGDCIPNMNVVSQSRRNPYNDIVYFTYKDVCLKTVSAWGMFHTPGFPSGHTSMAFASWAVAGLYLGSKVGAWNLSSGHVYKMTIPLAALCTCICIGWTRILDHQHSFMQVTVGTLIGFPSALLGYALKYCSLFGEYSDVPNYYLWKTIK